MAKNKTAKNKIANRFIALLLAIVMVINADMMTNALFVRAEGYSSATLQGKLLATDEQTPQGVEIRLYNEYEWYASDAASPLYVGLCDEDGIYEINDIKAGDYRIEFAFEEQSLLEEGVQEDMAKYAIKLADEEAEYTLRQVDGEDYFAFIPYIRIEGDTTIDVHFDEAEEQLNGETKVEDEDDINGEMNIDDEDDINGEDDEESTITPEMQADDETEEGDGEADKESDGEDSSSDALTIEELKDVDPLTAMATLRLNEPLTQQMAPSRQGRSVTGTDWYFDVYYVGEEDSHYVEKNRDFNLKYQMQFHNSRNLARGEVEIRIPRALFKDRDDNPVNPVDIAVPRVTNASQSIEVTNSPFNYYIDTVGGVEYLVFFNYKAIESGTNAAWQILYKNLKSMEIKDQTQWSLTPSIKVSTPEVRTSTPLRGLVDTEVLLSSVTKRPFYEPGKNYTPGLYTRNQVNNYIQGEMAAKFDNNFDNYRFVVWEVTVIGSATQPWDMYLKDSPTFGGSNGELVGYKSMDTQSYPGEITESYPNMITSGDYSQYTQLKAASKEETIRYRISVVTAYPSSVQQGTVLQNEIDVVLHPIDKVDPNQHQSDRASWTWVNYVWEYPYEYGVLGEAKKIEGGYNEGKNRDYEGWLDVYQKAKENGVDAPSGILPFVAWGMMRGYSHTHHVEGENVGKRIPGTSNRLTTVDDFVYAFPNSDSNEYYILDWRDYYFPSVRITQENIDYDIYEDMEIPSTASGLGNVIIFAMMEGSTTWEQVASVPWSNSVNSEIVYEFTEAQLARKPWRVKVEHETSEYMTICRIDLPMQIRHDSPAFEKMLQDYPDMYEVTIENISGVLGEFLVNGNTTEVFHNDNTGGAETNYSEPELRDKTMALYGFPLRRANAFAHGFRYKLEAGAHKSGTASNDPENSRVNLNYVLRAHDGYRIHSQEAADFLKANGLDSPGRDNVVFYDLLPQGVRFDPSKPIIAGRVTDLRENAIDNPASWNKTQITVKVDPSTDVINNYRGTGRTLVAFHISYEGADSALFQQVSESESQWREHFGVSFGAYYDWKDDATIQVSANIAAFMPAKGDLRPLLGTDEEVAKDDGTIVPHDIHDDYRFFGVDINGDGITNIRNVLYAKEVVYEDAAIAMESGINKLVRADANVYGAFTKSDVVEKSKGYTYDIAVSNTDSNSLENIVIYDRLENAGVDRQSQEPAGTFESDWWHGTFAGVNVAPLELLGIKPVVYYSANRNAVITQGAQLPASALTATNGWYLASAWTLPLADVKAVAVDISRKTDNTQFLLENMKSASFQINMMAPDAVPANATYAYNNPSWYSRETGTGVNETVVGNSVKVRLGEESRLEVIKEFEDEVPRTHTDWEFQFTAYQTDGGERTLYRNRAYTLYRMDEDDNWEVAPGIHATDSRGRFYLKADEKAVFEGAGISELDIEEEENPFWKQTIVDTKSGDNRTLLFKNKYQPVLYAQKILRSVPADKMEAVKDDVFTFQVLVEGQPLANEEYWIVDRVITNGNGIPAKLGGGVTDNQGQFKLKAGQIIALFPGDAGLDYTIKEVGGALAGDDWICIDDTVSGTLPVGGIGTSITNIYKWRDLNITKRITHQDLSEVAAGTQFTFQVRDENNNPITTQNKYTVTRDGVEITGNLDSMGRFTAECAGAVIKIERLEANKKYFIEETVSGTLYKAEVDTIEVTMPLYATYLNAEFVNEYQLRPISVHKIVTYDRENAATAADLATRQFHMRITVTGADGVAKALANRTFTVTKFGSFVENRTTDPSGNFWIRADEIATFKDAGFRGDAFTVTETNDPAYPQRYPSGGEAYKGILENDGGKATFINGLDQKRLMIAKEYLANDAAGAQYLQQMKDSASIRTAAAVTARLEVRRSNSTTYNWPLADTQVSVIDNWNGTTSTAIWSANSSFNLEPGKIVVLPTIADGVSYTLTESIGDQYRLYEHGDKWIEVKAKDHPVTGTFEANPMAVLYNELTGIDFNGSQINKRMVWGSWDVPAGSKLIWRLERYDGTVWQPASGVDYATFDTKEGATTDKIITTGHDGRITLTKSTTGWPIVRFLEVDVKLNLYTGMTTGDYRLIELLNESDPEWGYLAGYGKVHTDGDLTSKDANTFVNANKGTPVEIEKQITDGASSETVFTMILKQVLSTTKSPVTDKDDIVISEVAAGIYYRIHDSATGQRVGEGTTNANGEIFLKAGQYASLDLPYDTLWTVSEKDPFPYALKDLNGTPDTRTRKLDDNLMLIFQPSAEIEWVSGYLYKDLVENSEIYDALTGELVSFTGDVVIPDRIIVNDMYAIITGIEQNTFAGRSDITSIVLPDSEDFTFVGDHTFAGCTNLARVIIPDNVTIVGHRAFAGCSALTEVRLSASLTEIEDELFENCISLTKITIPEGVTRIGEKAFYNCSSLNEITLPDSLISIADNAFAGCSSLTEVTIPNNVTSIAKSAFEDCTSLTRLTIGNSVTSIGDNAFQNCSNLEDLIIPDSVTSIGNNAFRMATNLTRVIIGNGVSTIGTYAFAGNSKLTELVIGNGVTSIGDSAFMGCVALTKVTIPDNVTSIGNLAFQGNTALTEVTIGNGVTRIGNSAFQSCGNLETLTVGNRVDSIGELAFNACHKLTEVNLPDSLRTIEWAAFAGCEGLEKVTIGKGITSIASQAFAFSPELTDIIIDRTPNAVSGSPWDASHGTGAVKWIG